MGIPVSDLLIGLIFYNFPSSNYILMHDNAEYVKFPSSYKINDYS